MFADEIAKFAKKHEERLLHHVRVEAIQPLDNSELVKNKNKPLLSWCGEHYVYLMCICYTMCVLLFLL